MENKIERLRQCIKSNPNLSEEFKCNLGTLTDALVSVYPDYDYSNYERVLSSLSVHNAEDISSYSSYDKENNSIGINTSKIFEDRIDLQHLFLNNLLHSGSGLQNTYPSLEGFNYGLTEVLASTMNADEGMKKINVLESLAMSTFSKIVSPETLTNAYMTGDIGSIVESLESIGIEKDEFTKLLDSFNRMRNSELKDNSGFTDSEVIMINMFNKSVDSKLKNGTIDYEDISSEYDDFSSMLIFGKSELIAMYPHQDFSNITGFENVKTALDNAIVNSEIMEDVPITK